VSLTAEQKALRAKEFLKDDVFLECIEKAKKRVLAEWALTGIDDAQTRETLFYKHRALDEVLRDLRSLIDDWKMIENKARTN
jgi:hypothetical protein|tara:strand:- start:244 stop:489 length:246 start_codon:yes stop_codon:yes gene_type:complete